MLARRGPRALASAFLRYQDVLFEKPDISLGVHDVFNAGIEFAQPYAGGHPPLPGPSREVVLRLSYGR